MSEETKYTMADTEEVFDSYDDAVEYVNAEEIIYYNTAMEYLSEHDWSLTESAEIASDLGFELKNINSEMLATLHLQNELINSIKEIEYEQSED